MGRALIDFDGQRFGRLRVLGLHEIAAGGARWLCRCDCGVEKACFGHSLRRGQIQSCGCLRNEVGAAQLRSYTSTGAHASLRHGEARAGRETPEWQLWHSIKRRCKSHPDYAGRGVRMCEAWGASFEAFVADIGRRPSPQHSLDRFPDCAGNYEPGNVRWATAKQQARNRRNSFFIEHAGLRMTLAEWAERTGIQNTTIRSRLRNGWSTERALQCSPNV